MNKTTTSQSKSLKPKLERILPQLDLARTISWTGSVNYDNNYEVTEQIKQLMSLDPVAQINLVVSSPGGASGIAMSFYDSMRLVYQPNLHTIGAGDVDSSGIIIFLCGERRLLTPNTTMLLHLAGRTYESAKRFTTSEVAAMLKEDELKDQQYACVLAAATGNKILPADVLDLMAKNTVLSPHEAVDLGLAHGILE